MHVFRMHQHPQAKLMIVVEYEGDKIKLELWSLLLL
jgi:hypothetical protein